MKTNKQNVCSTSEIRNEQLDYKSLIEKFTEHGDLVILGIKGSCKTTLLKHLARQLRQNTKNRVIILETFPKWIHEFDTIPYYVIKDEDVVSKENYPYLDEGYTYIQWNRDYRLRNAEQLEHALKTQKDLIILIECEDMERISWVMSHVIYFFYRRQYLRAKDNCLETVGEHIYFLVEESHNLLDSTVIAKKVFNKLRKIQNEFRNLNMHLVCVALRLQDLNPKIRTKMAILLSQISLDDYQLKIRALLRNSAFKTEITNLPKGKFVYPSTDEVLETEPFRQIGKPYEIKPQPEQKQSEDLNRKFELWQIPQRKAKSLLGKLKDILIPKIHGKPKPEPDQDEDQERERDEDELTEESYDISGDLI